MVIACRTIRDELDLAAGETGRRYPTIWIESGLHMNPESLRNRLQAEIDHISNVDQLLLAFGFCGNALLGLISRDSRLIFPRVDDCITLMLGSSQRRCDICAESGTYFLTKGWLDYERNIWVEYHESLKRFGKEKTDRIYKAMLRHYRRLGIIDTGAYDLPAFEDRAKSVADDLGLEPHVIRGTLTYLKKLLTGPWDRDFVVIEPGVTVKMEHIYDMEEETGNGRGGRDGEINLGEKEDSCG